MWSEADVKAGQVYQSTDPRDMRRRVRVTGVHDGYASVQNVETGRRTQVRLAHLRPTLGKRGWRLVQDADLPV